MTGQPKCSSQSFSKARMISSVVAFLCLLAGMLNSKDVFTSRVASSTKIRYLNLVVLVLYSLMSIPKTFHGVVEVDNDATGNGSGRWYSLQLLHLTCSIAALLANGAPFCLRSLARSLGGLCPVLMCTFLAASIN